MTVLIQQREWDRVTKGGIDNAEGVILGEGKIGRLEIDGNGEWWDSVLRGTGINRPVDRDDDNGDDREEVLKEKYKREAEEARAENMRSGLVHALRCGGEAPGT